MRYSFAIEDIEELLRAAIMTAIADYTEQAVCPPRGEKEASETASFYATHVQLMSYGAVPLKNNAP